MQKRYTLFYGIGCLPPAFCGVLVYGLGQMNGVANLSGYALNLPPSQSKHADKMKNSWRWIFIIEGIISCLCAFVGYAFLVGFPEESHKAWQFLNEAERDFVIS